MAKIFVEARRALVWLDNVSRDSRLGHYLRDQQMDWLRDDSFWESQRSQNSDNAAGQTPYGNPDLVRCTEVVEHAKWPGLQRHHLSTPRGISIPYLPSDAVDEILRHQYWTRLRIIQ